MAAEANDFELWTTASADFELWAEDGGTPPGGSEGGAAYHLMLMEILNNAG